MSRLNRDEPDAADNRGDKLGRAVDRVERTYDDRWPARGQANIAPREYGPLEDVSRGGRPEEYKKYPRAR
jgi:hypothetical protein